MPRMLSDVLKSGNYQQGFKVLYLQGTRGEVRNCCLGVMECEVGIEFKYDYGSGDWFDGYGASIMPSDEVNILSGIAQAITKEEREHFKEVSDNYGLRLDDESEVYTRAEVLAALNDNGLEFDYIAEVLVERGWDVDLDALQEKIQNARC